MKILCENVKINNLDFFISKIWFFKMHENVVWKFCVHMLCENVVWKCCSFQKLDFFELNNMDFFIVVRKFCVKMLCENNENNVWKCFVVNHFDLCISKIGFFEMKNLDLFISKIGFFEPNNLDLFIVVQKFCVKMLYENVVWKCCVKMLC